MYLRSVCKNAHVYIVSLLISVNKITKVWKEEGERNEYRNMIGTNEERMV
jgi:hypothetical protein